ncbi:MAG: sugar phosphate nucleotidyltransferase [Crocinitomicaceae bacterium]|jgi:glucose-1-phosphate thymidylyltransferase|nr:sugar phosphate nucleotidyltransferase [Crocinitomicaceae bacterium]MDP4722767.1 sugar phosphate nucleotidyltransferase [Crocinitomicaceae bacterium]MDP4739541.1 sugar phosphate nucleotidyltransferase [Crocinitomicaceae bacterium]MDP4798713.1 sugar phosphate nucleotidyltransferase [Crocinitomicaceae bacterium]MDP4807508.1 sugar phosphate nucleotidyltransferase [Crocinitomicaceae bacterium]
MKVIVPMAGRGSRLRPHTLTIPKPLVPVGGKPIVHRLVADIARVCAEPIEEIAFVVGEFGEAVEKELLAVAASLGAKGSIHYQLQALGTAHAVLCAAEVLDGPVVVAFADTLFKADFKISSEDEGILWVKQIEDPSAFGVVQLDAQGHIIDFVEKPQTFVSDLAMIGIYYFKDGGRLKQELQYLIDNNVVKSGEYQLPDALRRLTEAGVAFKPGTVDEWLDCGNKEVTVETNQRVLEHDAEAGRLQHLSANFTDSVIIQPCYIGPNVRIERSVVGPHVSLGEGTILTNVNISNCIVGNQTKLSGVNLSGAMIGSNAQYNGRSKDLSLGDFSTVNE